MVNWRGQWRRDWFVEAVDQLGGEVMVLGRVVVETDDASAGGVDGRVLVVHERGHRRHAWIPLEMGNGGCRVVIRRYAWLGSRKRGDGSVHGGARHDAAPSGRAVREERVDPLGKHVLIYAGGNAAKSLLFVQVNLLCRGFCCCEGAAVSR